MDLDMTSSNAAENFEAPLVTSQMVLLCSWRIIKESSLLFGYLTLKSPITTVKCRSGLISEEQVGFSNSFLKFVLYKSLSFSISIFYLCLDKKNW